jgi:hypothetical protein
MIKSPLASRPWPPTCQCDYLYALPLHPHHFYSLLLPAGECRKNIGKDATLKHRFQPIQITEPTISSTISSSAVSNRDTRFTPWCPNIRRCTRHCCPLRCTIHFRSLSARQVFEHFVRSITSSPSVYFAQGSKLPITPSPPSSS